MSAVIDEHVDRLRRLYHTPSADIIADEVSRIEQQRDAYRADVTKEVDAHCVTIATLHERDRQIEEIKAERESLRDLLRRVEVCDELTGWCGEVASPLYDEIHAVTQEKR